VSRLPVAPEVRPSASPARRIVRSFGFALTGLRTILRTQPNFWVHLTAAGAALGLGIALRLTPVELAVLVLAIALVLVVESLNSALEALADTVSPGYHPLIERAKDMSAAAVLLAAASSVAIALVLFGPRLVRLVGWAG
jgi:diacylglycerol kinase (ATP)